MRILVTGGAGFIGSHLGEALLQRGHEVWALDDLSTGRIENLATFQRHPRFRFLEGNVMDTALVSGLVAQCEQVFHLAAAVGVKYVLENPLRSLITNIRGTEVALEAADAHQRKIMLVYYAPTVLRRRVSPTLSLSAHIGKNFVHYRTPPTILDLAKLSTR